MNHERTVDQLLDVWLDAGPTLAPARVAEAARLEVRSTRQMSALESWAPRRMPTMNTAMRVALATAAVAVAALIGLSLLVAPNIGDAPPPPPPSSPSWVTFTSDRYGYSIDHPADWRVVEHPGSVNLTGMRIGSAGTDLIGPRSYFRYGSDDGVVVVSAHELLAGESLADFSDRVSFEAACGDSGFARDDAQLDGEPAEFRRFECEMWDWIQITAIHGDRGYVVWAAATVPPGAHERPINDQFLASFRFTD